MIEKPVLFKSEGQQIVGMLHLPENVATPVPAVVFLHGFTGNSVEAHRLFVKQARMLALSGIASLRFDFRGMGNSAGEFSQTSVSSECKDVQAAFRYLSRRREIDCDRLGVVGLSMGGFVTALMLPLLPRLLTAVLWSPVAFSHELVEAERSSSMKRLLKQDGFVDYHGWALGRDMVDELMHVSPFEVLQKPVCPVLVINGSNDLRVPVKHGKAYIEHLRKIKSPVESYMVTGADHTFNSLRWEAELFGITFNWLHDRLL